MTGPGFLGGSLGAVPRGAGFAGGGSRSRVLFLVGVGLDLPSTTTGAVPASVLTEPAVGVALLAKGSKAGSESNAALKAALNAAVLSGSGAAVVVSGAKEPAPNGSNGA